MSRQFDNDDNKNEIDESQESQTNYQISIYASDKDIFNKKNKRHKISTPQIKLSNFQI